MNRVGFGYDVHRLVEGRKLILGGVEIPHTHGLLGHSDADVLTHAMMDALLGAAALGDIGELFPDDDPKFKDANSLELLIFVAELLRENRFYICNIDGTIVAQRPKLAPYREQMRQNFSRILNLPINRVSVKATTEERLGLTGTGKGIAAYAVCCLERN